MPPASMRVKPESSICSSVYRAGLLRGAARTARDPAAKRAAPRKRNMVAWRRRLIPRVMQCPRQGICLAGLAKGSSLAGQIRKAETNPVRSPYLFDGGWSSRYISRRRRLRLHGPMRRGRCVALIERDADPFFLAPRYMARPLQLFRRHKKREAVGNEQRAHDFKRGSGLRDIPYGAVDGPAAELDGSGLQYAVPRGDPGLVHDGIIGRRFAASLQF